MKLFHITIATQGRRALVRDETERRALVRALARVAGAGQLLFNLVDEHLHSVVRTVHPGRLADGLHRVLRSRRRDLVIDPPHVKPVGERAYLLSLVRYVLRQTEHHQVGGGAVPLALWTGSCVQDLLGVRLLPGFDTGPLVSELPRLNQREVLELVGLPRERIEPATDEALARAGPGCVVELAAGVHVVGPVLAGRSEAAVRARALAAHVAHRVGVSTRSLARLLGVQLRAVEYLVRRAVDPREVLVLRRRLTLEERAAGSRARAG